jgi:hypothetical protein
MRLISTTSSSIGTNAPQPTASPSTRATKKALLGAETNAGSKSPTSAGADSYRCRTSCTKAFKSFWASGLRGSSGETVIVIASEGVKPSERRLERASSQDRRLAKALSVDVLVNITRAADAPNSRRSDAEISAAIAYTGKV